MSGNTRLPEQHFLTNKKKKEARIIPERPTCRETVKHLKELPLFQILHKSKQPSAMLVPICDTLIFCFLGHPAFKGCFRHFNDRILTMTGKIIDRSEQDVITPNRGHADTAREYTMVEVARKRPYDCTCRSMTDQISFNNGHPGRTPTIVMLRVVYGEIRPLPDTSK